MKVVKVISSVLLLSFLVFTSLSATENGKENSARIAEKVLKNQVRTVVTGISTEATGSVYVYFNISENGFELANVEGDNSELVQKVKNAFKSEKIVVPSTLQGKYKIRVDFIDRY